MIILEKKPERDFILLNLSDPQLTGDEWEEGSRGRAILCGTVDRLIEQTHPDLITVSGDIAVAGDFQAYEHFAALMDSYRIPWAPVWGNHDNQEGEETVDRQADLMLSHPYCLYEKGEKQLGNGNYVIGIKENGKIIYGLMMMDSHNRMEYTNAQGETSGEWARLYPEQLQWYREQVDKLGNVKTAIITHIPLAAYQTAFQLAWNHQYSPDSVSPRESSQAKYWKPSFAGAYGVKYEEICAYPEDCGEFALIQSLGSTDTILVGHDHVNNFVLPYQGIQLAYSLKTGSGCYWNEKLSGGTLLRISAAGSRLEHIYVNPDEFYGT